MSLPYVADSDGSSVLVPSVEYKEICEVVSLKKISAHSLRVGLRLQRYLDQELFFERLCGSAAKSDRVEMDINTAVAVISRGCYWQRGEKHHHNTSVFRAFLSKDSSSLRI